MSEAESLLSTSSADAAWVFTPVTSALPDMTTLAGNAFNQDYIWVVVVGFVIAFILAFAVGANDVANSFGTSVGSKVLTLRQACILAVIFESLGACLLGSQVSDTIWKEIVDISLFDGQAKILLLGEVAALTGTASWLLIATLLKVPVSGTHAIVGATMGFSIVKHGYHGIQWLRIVRIVASWFVSPVLAGALSGFLFMLVRRFILKTTNPLEAGLRGLPIFYAITIFINTISIFMGGAISKYIPWWGGLIVSTGLAVITGTVVACAVVPWQRRIILGNIRKLKAHTAVPLMCAMNCSVATNLDLLDELAGTGPYSEEANAMGTSTTTLDLLGDTEEMGPTAEQLVEEVAGAEGNEQPVFVDDYAEDDELAGLRMTSRNTGIQAGLSPARNAGITIKVNDDLTTGAKSRALSSAVAPPLRSILQRRSYVYRPPPPPDAKPVSAATGVGERLNVTEEYDEDGGLQYHPQYGGDGEPASNLRMMRYSRVAPPVTGLAPAKPPMDHRISVVKKEPYYLPLRKSEDEEKEEQKPRGNFLVRCWQNIRTLGHREETTDPLKPPVDPPEIAAIFSFLQILTATFTAFAHGGNDVSNAIGPVVAIWVVFSSGHVPEQSSTPIWLLLFGGLGISVGLCVLGRKVIETVGSSLAVIIPSSGFCIGLGTATTVLLCSKIGLPVSTTHCIVGSVVAVGYLRSSRAVNWKVFGNIMGCALITVPVAGALAAGSMVLLGLLP
ncbi:sodium-dependent phosphate transporter 2-like [Paramacrobiotus metropolitanus]|uniref:sodium-dependent phosphate transporter 2-like n=1 Tax=Paramacrobiotus metropolitanus TaxID=2943436 RepID=UPI0024461D3C|nr:sodium-dependent phosphate transporter 2-like [Paramacrobiotus metropolitanus]